MTLILCTRTLYPSPLLHRRLISASMPKRSASWHVPSASPPHAASTDEEEHSNKRIKKTSATTRAPPILPATQTQPTLSKKRKQLREWLTPPFPDFKCPKPEVYQAVQDALYKLHSKTPLVTGPVGYDGEPLPDGELPNVLHTLIRVILSQNTNTTSECARSLNSGTRHLPVR